MNFDLDKSEISPYAKKILDQAIAALREDPNRKITVSSHTCDLGGSTYNQSLSERRTHAVLLYLKKMGVQESRIRYESKGLHDPRVKNNSETNRAKNRRSEITVFDNALLDTTANSN